MECLPRHKLHICHFPSRSFRFNGCSQRLIAPSSLQRPTETPPSTFNDPNEQFGVLRFSNRRFGRPIFSYFYFQVFKDQLRREDYNWLLKLGGTVSSLTMNISFLTILLLSGTQLIAITYPHRHKVLITKKRVVICVVCIWVYSILYSASLLMGIPEDISIKLGVFLNLTFIHFLVLVSYIALYVLYRRQLSSGFKAFRVNFASPSGNTNATEKLRKSQRQPVVACLLLTTCLVIFVTPVTVMWYVTLYWKPKAHDQLVKSTIANVVVDAILFVKFLIDPFIYVWRLPRFRQAIRVILTGKRPSTMRTVLYS